MKLKSIRLRNYRCHSEFNTALRPGLNLFAGPVGAGKSSILAAIALGISGRNIYTDGRGLRMEEQIQAGQKAFSIDLEFEDGLAVQRQRSAKAQALISNIPGILKNQTEACQEAIYERLGINAETLSAALDMRPVLSLDRKAQKSLILQLTRPAEIQIAPINGSLAMKYFPKLKSTRVIESIEAICELYDFLYARRSQAKKERAALPSPVPPEDVDFPPLEEVQGQLEAIRNQRAENASAMLVAQNSIDQYAKRPADDPSATPEALEELRGRLATFVQEVARLNPLRHDSQSEVNRLAAIVSMDKPACPSCGKKISAEDKKKAEFDLHAAEFILAANKKLLENATAQESKLRRELSMMEKVLSQRAALAGLAAAAEQAEASMPDMKALDEELSAKLARGEKVMAEVRALEQQRRQFESARQQSIDLTKEIEELEGLVQYFGPDGLRKELASSGSGALVERINGFLQAFGLPALTIESEPFRLMVGGIPAEQLSEGEQLLFETAMRIAVAQITGLNVMVMDAATRLGVDCQRLVPALDAIEQSGVQAFITLTVNGPVQLDGRLMKAGLFTMKGGM